MSKNTVMDKWSKNLKSLKRHVLVHLTPSSVLFLTSLKWTLILGSGSVR